ncbi:MAG TPA: hypothetical protein VMI31_00795 [Fimbriimonadaceae bacterium]|nr:hypothetical protein [Fimbriimonadaceae bacterium]
MIDELGGIQNIQLGRLWGAKKCVFVEGKDMDLLRAVAKVALPRKYVSFTNLPNFSTHGWSGLYVARGFARTFVTNSEHQFTAFCILDRDYRSDTTVAEQGSQAELDCLRLFVWERKEIESYFLQPIVIFRALAKKSTQSKPLAAISPDWIRQVIDEGCEHLKNATTDAISVEILNESSESKRKGVPHSNPAAREVVDANWMSFETRVSIVGGKDLFAFLNKRLLETVGLTVGPLEVARELRPTEVCEEMKAVLKEICG